MQLECDWGIPELGGLRQELSWAETDSEKTGAITPTQLIALRNRVPKTLKSVSVLRKVN